MARMTAAVTVPYLVEFEDESVLALSVTDESEKYMPNIIRLTEKEYTQFRHAESTYWYWQRTLKMKYRTRVREQLEPKEETTP